MTILYTDRMGGDWIPFNTPLSDEEIKETLRTENDEGEIGEGDERTNWLYYPASDLLPVFHSILLSDNSRWDAFTQRWTRYINDSFVEEWRAGYIAHYKPGERHYPYVWLDQGPGVSFMGVNFISGLPT